MNANELNQKAVELLDALWCVVSEFQGLRLEASDEAWDIASSTATWLDTLCDIEYTMEH